MLDSVDEFAGWGLLEAAGAVGLNRNSGAYAMTGISIGMRKFEAHDRVRAQGLVDSDVVDLVGPRKPNPGTAHVQPIDDPRRPANAPLVRGNVLGSAGGPAA